MSDQIQSDATAAMQDTGYVPRWSYVHPTPHISGSLPRYEFRRGDQYEGFHVSIGPSIFAGKWLIKALLTGSQTVDLVDREKPPQLEAIERAIVLAERMSADLMQERERLIAEMLDGKAAEEAAEETDGTADQPPQVNPPGEGESQTRRKVRRTKVNESTE